MPRCHQTHFSRMRRPKHACAAKEVPQSLEEDEMNSHDYTALLPPDEPPVTPTRPTEKRSDAPTRVDDALELENTATLPNAKRTFKDVATTTKGLVPVRGYMTVSASDSVEGAIVSRWRDRATAGMVSGLGSTSDQKSLSSDGSSMKVASETRKAMLVGDRGTEADNVDNSDGDGVVLELYRPTEIRWPENAFRNESPLPPAVLKLRPVVGGISGRRYDCLNGSREQGGGRYPTLSQSSRLEDVLQLSWQRGEICKISIFVDRSRAMTQDDSVRSSSADSFSVEGSKIALQSSGIPQRIDSSMNSQLFRKSRQRRHVTNGSLIRGVSRYESVASPFRSPQVSADIPARTLVTFSGPHLAASDQVALVSRVHGQHRHAHQSHHQHKDNPLHCDGGADGDGGDGVEGTVNSMASVDPLSCDGEAAMTTSVSVTDDLDLVRAPITGLRAIVLGNTVEEEEAAEYPEMRALQVEQLKHFYSKVVRQHLVGAKSRAPACGHLPPHLATGGVSTLQESQILCVETATESVALGHDGSALVPSQPFAFPNDGKAAPALVSALAKTSKHQEKRVMFNMDSVEQRRSKDGDAAQMPHSGTPQPTCAPVQRAPSPLKMQSGCTEMTVSSVIAEVNDSASWTSPLPLPLLCMGLKASALPDELVSATKEETSVGTADRAVPLMLLSTTQVRETPRLSTLRTTRRKAEYDDSPLTSPLTPPSSANLVQQQSLTPAEMVVAMPLPRAPPLTSVGRLSLIYVEEPRKRRFPGFKISKALKKHRNAAMPLTAGASDAIVLQKWGTLPASDSQPPNAHLASPNILSSFEVCLPHHRVCERRSTKQQRLPQSSPGSAVVQAEPPLSLHSAVGRTSPAHHRKEEGAVPPVFTTSSVRTARAEQDHIVPSAPTQPPSNVESTMKSTTAGLSTLKQKERPEEADEKTRRDAKYSTAAPFLAGELHDVKTNTTPLPMLFSCRPTSAGSTRDRAATKPSSPFLSGNEVSVLLPLPPCRGAFSPRT